MKKRDRCGRADPARMRADQQPGRAVNTPHLRAGLGSGCAGLTAAIYTARANLKPLVLEGHERLWTFMVFQSLSMGCFGLMVSNFGAMAMEPVGAVAGAAASLQGFVTTSGAAVIGAAIGKTFDNSTLPFTAGALCCSVACLVFVLAAEKWRLFQPHAGPSCLIGAALAARSPGSFAAGKKRGLLE